MGMSKTNYQTFWIVSICLFGLLLLAGCRKNSLNGQNPNVVPGLSQPIRISSGNSDAAEPAVAAATDGTVYVVWVDHDEKNEADVMIAHFTSDGRMKGSAVRVNSQAGVATAWRGDPPSIVVAPDHTVYVGWTARVESDSGHATDLYLSSSQDQGQTFGPPVKVNDDTKPAVHGMHSLAVGTDGRIYLAWLDERNIAPMEMKDTKMDPGIKGHHMESNRELFFASSGDGGHTFTPNQRVASDVCPCCKTALAIGPDNRLYLSWRQVLPGDLRHIAVNSSVDQGKTFSSPKIVSDDQWMIAGCPVSGASISVTQDGNLRVLWFSGGKNGQTGLYSSISTDHGASFLQRQLVAAGPIQGTPVLSNDAKSIRAIWASNEANAQKIFIAELSSKEKPDESFRIAEGMVPAATLTATSLLVAYVTKGDQHQEIRVVSAPAGN